MSVHHRIRRTSVLLAAAAVLVPTSLAPTVATADPPALNRDPCATVIARAASWPGETADGIRLVSDAYVSYLASLPECADTRR